MMYLTINSSVVILRVSRVTLTKTLQTTKLKIQSGRRQLQQLQTSNFLTAPLHDHFLSLQLNHKHRTLPVVAEDKQKSLQLLT